MSAQVKRVLVVDDDPVVGKSFNRVLTQQGYVVVTASNGNEALNKLQDGDYDCVFTDIRMPGMDGLELAEQVHARKSWTPVVIVTGYGSKDNVERARAAGVTAFLQKPVSPEMLEATARDAMTRPAPVIARGEIAKTIESVHAEVHGPESNLKKLGLLAAAPFIAFAFVFIGPFVALATLVGMSMIALAKATALRGVVKFVTNVATFVAASLIGLTFIVVGPVVGFVVLGSMLLNAAAQKILPQKLRTFIRNAALFFAAPFIGLAYILALPVVGVATLGWMAFHGKSHKPVAE